MKDSFNFDVSLYCKIHLCVYHKTVHYKIILSPRGAGR